MGGYGTSAVSVLFRGTLVMAGDRLDAGGREEPAAARWLLHGVDTGCPGREPSPTLKTC